MLFRNFEDIFNLNKKYLKTIEGFHVEFSLHNVINLILLSFMIIFTLDLYSIIIIFPERCNHIV